MQLEINNIRFTDIPKEQTLEDYARAKELFINEVSSCEDVVAIYQVGEISHIGMSDLDFFVVLKDYPKNSPEVITKIEECMKKESYIIAHHPIIIQNEIFSKINHLFPAFSLKKSYGRDYFFEEVDQKINQIILNDYIIALWPHEFTKLYLTKKKFKKHNLAINDLLHTLNIKTKGKREIPVRNILARLNSMKYPPRLLDKKYVTEDMENFVEEVINLRKNWFNDNSEEKYNKLVTLLDKCIDFCYDLIFTSKEMMQNISKTPKTPRKILLRHHSLIFKKDISKEEANKEAREILTNKSEPASILPFELQPQRDLLDAIMNNQQTEDIEINEEYKKLLIERYSLFKKQVDFLNRNKIPFKACLKYDYLTTKPLKSKIYFKFKEGVRKIKLK